MTQKLCSISCLYAVDGRCRLEYRHSGKEPVCPYYEMSYHYHFGGGSR